MMAGRWSSEHVVAEFRDLQASAMAVDCTGQYAVLAGRRALALVDLARPAEIAKKLPRQSKWEVSAVQWNPHKSHSHIFVTACNQRAELWNRKEASFVQEASLKAHTRVISDLDWSPEGPNLLSTCSVDTYTYVWDIRDTCKPTISLQAVAGASQVKWNKLNSNLLATTHDGDIRIWDTRKGSSPVQYIAGHLSKIHGLDWSPVSEYRLATSSQDCTVKFWNVTNPRQPESKLPSGCPVWRARYTPFGHGLITVVVPQLRRGENSLFLWYIDDLKQPVHTFVGHTDVVLEFQWRCKTESSDYQLVTWSKDQSLRLWRIDQHLQKLCGQETLGVVGSSPDSGLLADTLNSSASDTVSSSQADCDAPLMPPPLPIPTSQDKKGVPVPTTTTAPQVSTSQGEEIHSPQQPKTLQQEFTLVNIDIPNVTVDEMDAIHRTFMVTAAAASGKPVVHLTMTFPEAYPNNVAPAFQFRKPLSLDKSQQTKLIKVLRDTSLQHVKLNRSCIEPCLRQLVASLDSLASEEHRSPDSETPYNLQQGPPGIVKPTYLHMYSFGTYHDSIPFPRTSGARFCSSGALVCFTRRTFDQSYRRSSSTAELTPRALSALSVYSHAQGARTPEGAPRLYNMFAMAQSPPTNNSLSISNFYKDRDLFKDRTKRPRSKSRVKENVEPRSKDASSSPKKRMKTGPVLIYNIECLLPVSKQLAENYVLQDGDIPAMCNKNAAAAAAVGRQDLVQVWSLAALANTSLLSPTPDPDCGTPWAIHPFGTKFLKSLLHHYSSIYDVQTLAMLCCAFGAKCDSSKAPPSPASKSAGTANVATHNYNAYHTIHPSDTSLKGWAITVSKMRRSNSWSDMAFDDYRFNEESRDPADLEKEQHQNNLQLLPPQNQNQYDQFKKAYADLLYRWGLLTQRAEVLKYVSMPAEPHKGVEFNTVCQHCGNDVRGAQCWHCKNYVFQCSICHITVRGLSSFCLACGHGGHAQHLADWFSSHTVCPTGCGCNCLIQNPMGAETRQSPS